MTFEGVLKRFQFDLEMGRFIPCNEYSTRHYAFYSNDSTELIFLIGLLSKLNFEKDLDVIGSYLSEQPTFGVCIDRFDKKYWFFEEASYASESDNPVPDYIKEFVKNDTKWNH